MNQKQRYTNFFTVGFLALLIAAPATAKIVTMNIDMVSGGVFTDDEPGFANVWTEKGFETRLPAATGHHFHFAAVDPFPGWLSFHNGINGNAVLNIFTLSQVNGENFDLVSFDELGTVASDVAPFGPFGWTNAPVKVTSSAGDMFTIPRDTSNYPTVLSLNVTYTLNWTDIAWVKFKIESAISTPEIVLIDEIVLNTAYPLPVSDSARSMMALAMGVVGICGSLIVSKQRIAADHV